MVMAMKCMHKIVRYPKRTMIHKRGLYGKDTENNRLNEMSLIMKRVAGVFANVNNGGKCIMASECTATDRSSFQGIRFFSLS